jgi:hypothetical protein
MAAAPASSRIGVSDSKCALAFANIEKAASYYGVNLAETSWHGLEFILKKSRSEPDAKRSGHDKKEMKHESSCCPPIWRS